MARILSANLSSIALGAFNINERVSYSERLPLIVLVELVGPEATKMLLAASLVDLESHQQTESMI